MGLALLLAACSLPATLPRALKPTVPTEAQPATCPLTGTPSARGGLPRRPALAVKVDNYPQARPQSGLDQTDVVFEEPVEGAITRYVAVFQCESPPQVGPIRSARNIDIGILGQLGRPLLVSVGGITPVLDNIAQSPITEFDLRIHGSVSQHPPGRFAPYDTYSAPASLWKLDPSDTTPPAPLFSFSSASPAGTAASTIAIPFSATSNVVWRYNPTLRLFQRFYGTAPDLMADGAQNGATNVIVQFVQLSYGPWVENSGGGLEVQANLYENASGRAEIFRDGIDVAGTWRRSSLNEPTQFLSASGNPIALAPGRTWVELVPDTVTVTVGAP
ncbi:MAG TPA: DUF3048 domain-containing protein [Acidimicrobiales bacterium]|nr:DUF3048 domain-containing protein [Acidimicrobiales bacterium]